MVGTAPKQIASDDLMNHPVMTSRIVSTSQCTAKLADQSTMFNYPLRRQKCLNVTTV